MESKKRLKKVLVSHTKANIKQRVQDATIAWTLDSSGNTQAIMMESDSGLTTSTPTPAPSTDTDLEIIPLALRTREAGGKELEVREDTASNCLTGVQTDAMIIQAKKPPQPAPSMKETCRQLTLPISLPPISSLSDGLAKIIAILGNGQDKEKVQEAVYSLRQLEYSGLKSPSISLLRTCPDYSRLMTVMTSTKHLDCLPTLGMTCNGKFLIQGGFSPRTESGLSLSDILLDNVDPKYFLSEKQQKAIMNRYKRANQKEIDFDSDKKILADSGQGRTLQQLDLFPGIRVGGDVTWLIDKPAIGDGK